MSENLSDPKLKDSLMKTHALSLLLACLFALSGCNTVKGVGQDLQKAGSAIEGAVKKN
jgi:predicted small secreted protein